MEKLFLNGACAELAGIVCCVVFSTSSLVAAEIPAAANSHTPVAIVNGQSISDAELSTAAAAQLRQILLQEYQVKKDVLENLVNQKLVEAEARRQGLTVEKLLEQEVDAKVGEPSETELKAFYLGQKDRWNLPFAEIQPQLRTGLRQGRIQQAHQDYFKHLREAPGVAILLRPPKVNVSADPGRRREIRKCPMLQQPRLNEHARKLGLDERSFEACLTTGKFRSAVQSDYRSGIK